MQLYEMPIAVQPWIGAILLALWLIICALQPQTIAQSLTAIISPIQRRYTSGGNHPVIVTLRLVLVVGTIAMAIVAATHAWKGNVSGIEWGEYGRVVGLVVAAMLGRGLVDKWIAFTFRFTASERTYYSYRGEMWMVVCLGLLVVSIGTPWLHNCLQWLLPAIIAGVYYIWLWWKIMQMIGWSLAHIVYTTLYIVHVEILPIVAVVAVSSQINK